MDKDDNDRHRIINLKLRIEFKQYFQQYLSFCFFP